MTEWIYIPVPSDLVLEVYALLGEQSKPDPVAERYGAMETERIQLQTTPGTGAIAAPRKTKTYPPTLDSINKTKVHVRRLGTFTLAQLSKAAGIHESTVRKVLVQLEAEGWVERRDPGWGQNGRKPITFRYLPAGDDPKIHPRTVDTVGTGNHAAPVAGTGRPTRSSNTEVGKLIATLRQQGWSVTRTGGDHFKARKGGTIEVFAGTPSDPRAIDNMRARLRRAGANV